MALAAVALLVSACSGDDAGGAGSEGTGAAGTEAPGEGSDSPTLRLGYFANVTHAPAIIGVFDGLFQEQLGDTELEVATFNAGTEAIEAMFSGAIDMTFIGPNPAINGFAQSEGEALRIVAGTTSGGASLVVNDEIQEIADLQGRTLATPSLGNTQDVAARAWLIDNGFEVTLEGGGDVNVVPQDNSETLAAFQSGDVQAAWVPEPWATRLVLEGGGHVLLDEAELWPDGQFVTTHLIVATGFLEEHPDLVDAVLRGLVEAVDHANDSPDDAQATVSAAIEEITGSAIAPETIAGAWENLEFTLDPIAASLQTSADNAVAVELLDPVDLTGIYALDPLNAILAEEGRPAVSP
jgi:NitT/TauT family transport system substrate-binding protein